MADSLPELTPSRIRSGILRSKSISTIGSLAQSTIAQDIARLLRYNTNEFRDLPANHAAEGVLANGDIFYTAGAMLTASDKTMLKSITGDSAAFVESAPLAIAIGTDRADAAIGWGQRTNRQRNTKLS